MSTATNPPSSTNRNRKSLQRVPRCANMDGKLPACREPSVYSPSRRCFPSRKPMSVFRRIVFASVVFLFTGGPVSAQAKKDEKEPETVSYYKHIRPIFQQHCQ